MDRLTYRFIPTHVGNTAVNGRMEVISAVHPHACGEHRFNPDSGENVDGSSPRMWGTLQDAETGDIVTRFIPTHVGNTRDRLTVVVITAVHPHACGEHQSVFVLYSVISGSSPRMWGTPIVMCLFRRLNRFIPTHVGNTKKHPNALHVQAVHPHACGEHVLTYQTFRRWGGSSPRMWGTHEHG